MSEKKEFVTPVGVCHWPHLLKKNDGGTMPSDKYEVTISWDKSEKDSLRFMHQLAVKAIQDKWGGDAIDSKRTPLRDGDRDNPKHFSGKYFCKFMSDYQPAAVNSQLNKMSLEEFYSGCLVKVAFNVYTYEPNGGGANLGLQHLQFIADGKRLVGSDPRDVFSAVDASQYEQSDDVSSLDTGDSSNSNPSSFL